MPCKNFFSSLIVGAQSFTTIRQTFFRHNWTFPEVANIYITVSIQKMERKTVSKRIAKKETKAFTDLKTIIDDLGSNCTVTQTDPGTHWDATIATPNQKFEYVELKRRNCRWEQYPDAMALKKTKAEYLQQIQDSEGVKVVVIWLYPKSDTYVVKSLDEIIQENNMRDAYFKVTEEDDDSEKEWQKLYYITLKESDRRHYVSKIN